MKRYLLVDGFNLFIRSFAANPSMNDNGDHNGGVVGFLCSINKCIRDIQPTHVIVAWDGEGGSLRRKSLFKDYKDGRKPRLNREYDFETADVQKKSFKEQFFLLKDLLTFLPINVIDIKNIEADDVISFVSLFVLNSEDKKIIVSTDKDYFQLLRPDVIIYNPIKKKYITSNEVVTDYKVLVDNFIYIKALCGDKSDNIAGYKGIGEKTAVKLFPFLSEKISTINDVLSFAEQNKDNNLKYKNIFEHKNVFIDNVNLMQLSTPIIHSSTASVIREQVINYKPTLKIIDARLKMTKCGIDIKVTDFYINMQILKQKSGG